MTPPDSLARARRRAARIERFERGWPVLLPAFAVLCGFAALALLALPQKLPVWLHALVVLALAGFAARQVWQALLRTKPASAEMIDRRIERRSGLRHHPLLTLSDHPAGRPNLADPVWQAHLARARQQLDQLRAGAPRLGLWRHRGGRAAVLLLPILALAWIIAGGNARDRLASGFLPGLFDLPGPAPWMQAWITPPAYANAAPVFLTDSRDAVTMPFGSVLQVSLTGLHGAPRLRQRPLDHGAAPANGVRHFERLAAGSWRLVSTLDTSLVVSLRGNGRQLADWTIHVAPLPPSLVAWNGKPGPAEAWRTRLPWRISTPYGVSQLAAVIDLAAPKPHDAVLIPQLRVRISLAPGTRAAHGAAMPDLSADPRAGEAVIAHLTATDDNGQTRRSAEARFILPARAFRSPLARAVIDARKRLALGRESRAEAAIDLETLGGAPGQFASDSGLFLNLTTIAALLRDNDVSDADAVPEAVARLWELALGLEDGLHNDHQDALAAADMRAARQAVSSQLDHMRELGDKGQSNREQSELQRRIEALSQAIARRMRALAEQAERQHTVLPPMPDARMLSGQDLARMMRQMRDAAGRGDTKEAMQRLAQMQSMLDRMRAATPRDLQNAEQQAQAAQAAREQTQDLRDLVKREAGLLDQTQARRAAKQNEERARSAARIDPQTAELLRRLGIPPSEVQGEVPGDAQDRAQGGPPGQTDADPAQQAARTAADQARAAQSQQDGRVQHGLGRALDELAQEFRELSGGHEPGGLAAAGADMTHARKALASGQEAQAEAAEERALAELQKGGKQMQQLMASSGAGSPMFMPGMEDEGSGGTPGEEPGDEQAGDGAQSGPRDPLGRPVASGPQADGGNTHVPDKFEQLRARAIEQELRRRDTDRTRPPNELHYLDRLLQPF